MLLPVMVAPIFAIYSHRHTIDSYSVNTGGYEIVDKYASNEVSTINDLIVNNIYHYDELLIDSQDIDNDNNFSFRVVHCDSIDIDSNDTYLNDWDFTDFNSNNNDVLYFDFTFNYLSFDTKVFLDNGNSYIEIYNDSCFSINFNNVDFYVDEYSINNYKSDIESTLLELPSISNFNVKIVIYNEGLTFNDTDIGSQFIYDMYNCVDKYFNYDRVFNFADLYSWLNTTFFSGSAPLGFFIFWHLLIYWLLTSLLWLLFDVLMYVPQLVHRWLDKASLS